MLVSFTPHGKGSQNPRRDAKKAVGYLLSEHDHTGTERAVAPVLMQGNASDWCQIVGEGNHAGRYTSGSLNFAESNLPDDTLQSIIEDFERALLPGLDPDQYSSLWVKHEDKGRTELHFIVAGEELRTGKRLNAYYHSADMPRIDAWKDAINAEYDFIDPNAPSKKSAVNLAKKLPKQKREAVEFLTDHISERYEAGAINSRDDVIEELKTMGLEIARQTPSSISIKNPEGGQNIRLKGAFYEKKFARADDSATDRIRQAEASYNETRTERAKEARECYERMHQKRAEDNARRYQKNPANQNTHRINNNGFIAGNSDRRRRSDLSERHDTGSKTPDPFRPDFMRKRRRTGQPERVPADEITTKEKDDGKNRRSNNAYFDRIYREKRKRIAESSRRHETLDGILRKVSKRAGEAVERERKLDRVRSAIDTHNRKMTKQKKKSAGFDLS